MSDAEDVAFQKAVELMQMGHDYRIYLKMKDGKPYTCETIDCGPLKKKEGRTMKIKTTKEVSVTLRQLLRAYFQTENYEADIDEFEITLNNGPDKDLKMSVDEDLTLTWTILNE